MWLARKMSFIMVYVTNKDMPSAKKLAEPLLKKRMIASVNFFPITSCYWWQGKLVNGNEVVALLKTWKENWKKLEAEIKKTHPYKTPCIIRLDAKANKEYEDWIRSESRV